MPERKAQDRERQVLDLVVCSSEHFPGFASLFLLVTQVHLGGTQSKLFGVLYDPRCSPTGHSTGKHSPDRTSDTALAPAFVHLPKDMLWNSKIFLLSLPLLSSTS